MTARLVVRASAADAAVEAALGVAALIAPVLAVQPRCSVALSGGSTPLPMNRVLAAQRLPWPRIDFYFADERAVPPDHPDSNYRGARESLFEPLGLPAAQCIRMEAERDDLDAAARAYETRLPAHLEIVVLGLGPDGHTCSLFPGHTELEERARRVLPIFDSPKPPPRRMTLTPAALSAARARVMLVTGVDKAEAVRRSIEEVGPAREVPGRLAREGTWYLDAGAASKLRGESRG